MTNNHSVCPVCNTASTRPFLARPSVVVHQHLVMGRPDLARALKRGDLSLHCCASCGFIFNAAFDFRLIDYGAHYDNCQTCSPHFAQYTEQLAQHLLYEKGVRDCRIIEIGCGEGTFLRRLVEAAGANNRGWGFDPSYRGLDSSADDRLRFVRRYYDEHCTDISADVVVCRHVIEHVPDPVGLLRTVHRALSGSPSPRLFFETPCVDWILTHGVIWDFFYEHCSYFTAHSLRTAFERAAFSVTEIRHVFGGQYLWLEAIKAPAPNLSRPQPDRTVQLAAVFGDLERKRVAAWIRRVEELARRGKIAIWGAGAKGVTFANLVDPHHRLIDCVVDLNPRKANGFLPGTGHPIVGPRMLGTRDVSTALVLNPNYLAEITDLMKRQNTGVRVIDLMEVGEDPS